MSVPYSIQHETVAKLDENQREQAVAILDMEAAEVDTDVVASGRDPTEALRNVVEGADGEVEHVVVLGEEYFDLDVLDSATLVALEQRVRQDNRGSTMSEGALYAVLKYDSHVVDDDRWSGKRELRLPVTDLLEQTELSKTNLKRAVNFEDRSLSDVRYLLQDGLRNPR